MPTHPQVRQNLSEDIHALLDEADIAAALKQDDPECLRSLKQIVQRINDGLKQFYYDGAPVEHIVFGRAALIDRFLITLFDYYFADNDQPVALVAVGGYGRGELHPGSDIDLMLLLKDEESELTRRHIEQFITTLWDSRLEIGHSVRTVDECIAESEKDITVATNIMESRLLSGEQQLFDDMKAGTGPDATWNSRDFFQAKLEEQLQRNGKYNDTSYNLEPNIKESRGGLRDIQMIGWVAKRHFGATHLYDLVIHGFLREDELQTLIDGQLLLWRIRCSLHYLAGRREDRMLFDYQKTLALEFGYEDDPDNPTANAAIESFMQSYFRTVMELERLNEMLLQLFREAILYADQEARTSILNEDFQLRHNYIEARSSDTFKNNPCALLELFYLIQQHPEIQGVRAETIRSIREHKHLINDAFRESETSKRLFMKIMSHGRGVTHELRRMNRYGILAAYIPAFESIVGRMQYDLFHAYTVDQHILFVIRNIRRLSVPEFCHEYPLASGVFQHIAKPVLLYLAGLFHDIAKGRNGDHSELGAVDAYEFCKAHFLSEEDAQLVSWLVKSHLLMSITAQRKDISDPHVIATFAEQVESVERLDYLYLLTISDIRGTNPKQWNSWKDKLFIELYSKTADWLNRGLRAQSDELEDLEYNRTAALRKLEQAGIDSNQVEAIWKDFTENYFIRHTPGEVFWHTKLIYHHKDNSPLVDVRIDESIGGLELVIHMPSRDNIFFYTVSMLSQMNLNVVNAHVMMCKNHYAFETFKIISDIQDAQQLQYLADEICKRLRHILSSDDPISTSVPPPTRAQKHFMVPTEISFTHSPDKNYTRIQIDTADQRGLLAIISRVLAENNVRIHDAFVSTAGEKAIDYFDVTDMASSKPLTEQQMQTLRDILIKEL